MDRFEKIFWGLVFAGVLVLAGFRTTGAPEGPNAQAALADQGGDLPLPAAHTCGAGGGGCGCGGGG